MTDPQTITEEGRRAAEARMLDTFAIQVSNGIAYNPASDAEEETFTTVFTTPGRLASKGWPVELDAGGRTSTTEVTELHIPAGAPAIPPNAYALCVTADTSSDLVLAGRRFRIVGMTSGSSQKTARRLQVTEVIA